MITVLVVSDSGEVQIRKYDTDDAKAARDMLIKDWIDQKFVWEWWEYWGPNCTAEVPAFSPDFLSRECLNDYQNPEVDKGVTIYEWICITGFHGTDEHIMTAYFVPGG